MGREKGKGEDQKKGASKNQWERSRYNAVIPTGGASEKNTCRKKKKKKETDGKVLRAGQIRERICQIEKNI